MFNFRNIDLWKAWERFPISCLSAIITTCAFLRMIYIEDGESSIIRLAICGAISLLSFLSLKIAAEAYGWVSTKLWIGRGLVLMALIALFFGLPEDMYLETPHLFRLPYQLTALALFLHLLVSYVPFIGKGGIEDFWEYNKDIFLRFVESAFFSTFLFIGLTIAIVALDKLFGIDIDGKYYGYLFVLLAGIFHTMYFLSKFPKLYYDNVIEKPIRAYLVFSQYILIPLVLIYLAILYAYAAKILFQWELPVGWVSQLSLWFSVTGIFAFLLNYFNPQFTQFKLTRYYKSLFFMVMLVPVILVFVAIWRRINDYGITEPRYVVALLGVWLLFVSMYFILSKKKDLKVIPISLSIAVAFSILSGPFNMFNASLKSQQKRFIHELENKGLMKDQKIIPVKENAKQNIDSLGMIVNAIRYLDRRSQLQFVNKYLEEDLPLINEYDSLQRKDKTDHFPNSRILAEALNIPHYFQKYPEKKHLQSFHFNTKQIRSSQLDSNTYFVQLELYDRNSFFKQEVHFQISEDNKGLNLVRNGSIYEYIALDSVYHQAKQTMSNPDTMYQYDLNPDAMQYHHRSDLSNIHFLINSMEGFEEDSQLKYTNLYGSAIVTFLNQSE